MSEQSVVRMGDNSPEEVAFKLLREIAGAEDRKLFGVGGKTQPDRKWILDTYAECIIAVRAPANRFRK